ncbi:MAG: peptide chain release factor N(5)-glutamine methyltransferase, partial [Pseudomonadota bacterium]
VTSRLEAVSESPRLDAEILLGRSIDMPRSYLFAHPEDELDEAAVERLEQTVARRLAGEPMAYITGIKEFWSMELMVTPATLVPRPETEILVERALQEMPRRAEFEVLDLGTGSGAVALAIARERRLSSVTAIDQSADAVRVAEHNARMHDLDNVICLQGDWTEPVRDQRFDIVVSNPPYVADDDPALATLAAEPRAALAAGADGLDAIRRLAAECVAITRPGGWLVLEHGSDQADAVAAELEANGWQAIDIRRDYAGLDRVTAAKRPAADADRP